VLGRRRSFRARFQPSVRDAGLQLHSTDVELRVGRHHLRIPAGVAPRIRLTERPVGAGATSPPRQHIAITVDVPVLGRIYEYSGTFTYEIVEEPA
jgi:hypothetical protein